MAQGEVTECYECSRTDGTHRDDCPTLANLRRLTPPPAPAPAEVTDCICPTDSQRAHPHTHECWLVLVKRLAQIVAERNQLRESLTQAHRATGAHEMANQRLEAELARVRDEQVRLLVLADHTAQGVLENVPTDRTYSANLRRNASYLAAMVTQLRGPRPAAPAAPPPVGEGVTEDLVEARRHLVESVKRGTTAEAESFDGVHPRGPVIPCRSHDHIAPGKACPRCAWEAESEPPCTCASGLPRGPGHARSCPRKRSP